MKLRTLDVPRYAVLERGYENPDVMEFYDRDQACKFAADLVAANGEDPYFDVLVVQILQEWW